MSYANANVVKQRYYETVKDSPHPHCSVMFGFWNVNRLLNLSSTQSISLPKTFISAFESIKTLTPSCSTCSSNFPGLSTYSRWYAEPEQPLFLTPTRISFGSGSSSNSRNLSTAVGVSVIAAFRNLNLLLGLLDGAGEVCVVSFATGLDCCASFSGRL